MTQEYRDRFADIETRWQQRWEGERVFAAPDRAGERAYYCLEMLPYPSGHLHMGHVRNYAIGDAVARFRRMRGDQVLHPMGWDSFGLPAENAAIERGIPPLRWTEDNIAHMGRQMRRLGFSYDWDREIAAHRPDYYRWNQWFFLRMLERGLAYRSRRWVNWCGSCATVLANEQVEAGRCWRCHSVVGRRDLEQWFLKITAYADELDAGLHDLTGWPEPVRIMQRNWIGRSPGARVSFPILDPSGRPSGTSLQIFTTRLDTIFGATFCVIAPGHPILQNHRPAGPAGAALAAFLDRMARREPARPGDDPEEKEGVDTGLRVLNPYTGETVPLFTANFVLMEYGTGAIMAVPAHDERDFDFARRYGLPIRTAVLPPGAGAGTTPPPAAMTEDGVLTGSGPYDGLSSAAAREAMLRDGAARGFARTVVSYRLLDWGISRQRYWGTPIPVVYCDGCGMLPVPDSDLPVRLPEDAPLTGSGGSPLAQLPSFVNTTCPRCRKAARRETDTMDTFVDSSWYFLRYCDPRNAAAPFDPAATASWLPIDLYIGGIEHATMHLIYCRFFTKVLRDLGLVPFGEPIRNLLCQGMVLKGGTAMSKSKGNIVDPDDMVRRYGADTTRLFALFAAPPEKDLEWNEQGVEGCFRFLERVWRLFGARAAALRSAPLPGPRDGADDPRRSALRRRVHHTIRRITIDIEKRLHLNTPIAALMELLNEAQEFERGARGADDESCLKEAGVAVALLLQPFAPHIAEELWSLLAGEGTAATQPWPEPLPAFLHEDEVEVVVQVNGRVRGRVRVPSGAAESEVLDRARADPRVASHLEGRALRKTVYVPGKLLNLVV